MEDKYYSKYHQQFYKNQLLETIIDSQKNSQSGGNKCDIDKSDKIFFGSGGSQAIIVITKSKKVYKMFPIFYIIDVSDEEKNFFIKRIIKNIKNEIEIGKILTANIINKNISPHYVKFVDDKVCGNSQNLFKGCNNYVAYLKKKNKDHKCIRYFGMFPFAKIEDKFTVLQLEYCPETCSKLLSNISTDSIPKIKLALDRLFFQICYTIFVTQRKFPFFVHYDLFVRNILGVFENNNNKYYRYILDDITFDVPASGFFPKIGDFGLSNLNDNFHDRKLIKSEFQDLFNFVLDVYDGGNLGSQSLFYLFSIIKNKKERQNKIKFIDDYFNIFFNVRKMLGLFKYSKGEIDWKWGIVQDKEFRKYIEMKSPEELLRTYFLKVFPKDDSHKILKTFGNKC